MGTSEGGGSRVEHPIRIIVNGERHEILVRPTETLLDVLRTRLGLTGTKKACNTGECGACTVLMDGKAVSSCLTLAVESDGADILTIEGLSRSGELDPIQNSFLEHGAVQCGFCTPGMIMAAKGLLEEKPEPEEQDVRKALAGHLCRCSGYVKIVEAVLDAKGRRQAPDRAKT
jgi:carbon-monoxide dehydrogenase small subunit